MADHAMKFLDALGLNPMDVLGFSLGGIVAQVIYQLLMASTELQSAPRLIQSG
jgi:pimeloyl-ACP methyl ester carboxylesterase